MNLKRPLTTYMGSTTMFLSPWCLMDFTEWHVHRSLWCNYCVQPYDYLFPYLCTKTDSVWNLKPVKIIENSQNWSSLFTMHMYKVFISEFNWWIHEKLPNFLAWIMRIIDKVTFNIQLIVFQIKSGLFAGCFLALLAGYVIMAHLTGLYKPQQDSVYMETVYPVLR